jgi:hypothetical protein
MQRRMQSVVEAGRTHADRHQTLTGTDDRGKHEGLLSRCTDCGATIMAVSAAPMTARHQPEPAHSAQRRHRWPTGMTIRSNRAASSGRRSWAGAPGRAGSGNEQAQVLLGDGGGVRRDSNAHFSVQHGCPTLNDGRPRPHATYFSRRRQRDSGWVQLRTALANCSCRFRTLSISSIVCNCLPPSTLIE